MLNPNLLRANLAHFKGSEQVYRTNLGLKMTEGVYYLAKNAECFWLIDEIAGYQEYCKNDPMLARIQFWKLTVKDSSAVLRCERDKDDQAIFKRIPFTDFPLDEIKLYVCGDVIMLPSEY